MTISLAFLAPKLVRAAVEGRLPRGINVESLRELRLNGPGNSRPSDCSPNSPAVRKKVADPTCIRFSSRAGTGQVSSYWITGRSAQERKFLAQRTKAQDVTHHPAQIPHEGNRERESRANCAAFSVVSNFVGTARLNGGGCSPAKPVSKAISLLTGKITGYY